MYIIKSRSIVSRLDFLAKHRIVIKVRLRDVYNSIFQMVAFNDVSLKDTLILCKNGYKCRSAL